VGVITELADQAQHGRLFCEAPQVKRGSLHSRSGDQSNVNDGRMQERALSAPITDWTGPASRSQPPSQLGHDRAVVPMEDTYVPRTFRRQDRLQLIRD